jgi:AcrR family transcriptional regulator
LVLKQRKSKSTRQQQIVSAAKKLIVQYGSEHVTVRRVAKEIGVTEAAIYRHFVNKKQILSFLLDDIENSLAFDIEDTGGFGSSPLAFLQQALVDLISNTEQKRGISFQVIAEIISLGDSQLNKKAYEVINKFLYRVQVVLSKAVKSGDVRPDVDPDTIAVLLFGMMQGMVTLWALSHYNRNLEQQYRNLWNFIHTSISQN